MFLIILKIGDPGQPYLLTLNNWLIKTYHNVYVLKMNTVEMKSPKSMIYEHCNTCIIIT